MLSGAFLFMKEPKQDHLFSIHKSFFISKENSYLCRPKILEY